MSAKRVQPIWPMPAISSESGPSMGCQQCPSSRHTLGSNPVTTCDRKPNELFVYNSLTRSKTKFVAMSGRAVRWYNCGPTVYDSAHMGHARSYVSFDIIRRVLHQYFNYDLFFVQNVTDIDDKIIERGRQRYLFQEYSQKRRLDPKPNLLSNDIRSAIQLMCTEMEGQSDPDKKSMYSKMIESAQTVVDSSDPTSTSTSTVDSILSQTSDILSHWLSKTSEQVVTDTSMFTSLARHYENEFNEDMKALNVLPADCVTRVSEFIPEIVEYIEVIIGNGFAYESNGSVYFHTNRFDSSEKHFYAKLVPEAFDDNKALAEGEGDLSYVSDKRNVNDFALWKSSKPGEPFWQSPWGRGRPGWHIECSAMASSVIGQQMDIHSGGYDLKFPHHDNEMAQAEAYYDSGRPWVNYFLHSGHLTISGCKMSKSLKNFITIKEALKRNSWRQLRFAFLLHSWRETLDYSDNTMNDAIHYEKLANEFFLTVKDLIRTNDNSVVKWTPNEVVLNNKFHELVDSVDSALCDNIDTRSACEHIRGIISASNLYLQECTQSPNVTLMKSIAVYITKIFDIFGVGSKDQNIGFATESTEVANRETIVMPFLEVISDLRAKVRSKAMQSKNSDLLAICDQLRDDILPELGVRLEDYELSDGVTKTRLKLMDRETILREREERLEAQEVKRIERERKLEQKMKAEAQREEESKLCPQDMFTNQTDKYSAFSPRGMPTHDSEGKELSKSQIKKLSKLYEIQSKKHKQCLKCEHQLNNQ